MGIPSTQVIQSRKHTQPPGPQHVLQQSEEQKYNHILKLKYWNIRYEKHDAEEQYY